MRLVERYVHVDGYEWRDTPDGRLLYPMPDDPQLDGDVYSRRLMEQGLFIVASELQATEESISSFASLHGRFWERPSRQREWKEAIAELREGHELATALSENLPLNWRGKSYEIRGEGHELDDEFVKLFPENQTSEHRRFRELSNGHLRRVSVQFEWFPQLGISLTAEDLIDLLWAQLVHALTKHSLDKFIRCAYCGKPILPERSTRKTCSGLCRNRWARYHKSKAERDAEKKNKRQSRG